MSNKSLSSLRGNKDYIVKRIGAQLKHVVPMEESRVYERAKWPFINPDEFVKNENNKKAMLGLSDQISLIWEEMIYKVEVLNLYRAACIEHRKMAASDKIPENYKEINKNYILEIEKALLDNGFTKEEMQMALSDAKFEKAYLPEYTEKVNGKITKFSQEHGLQLNEKKPIKSLVESMMYHTRADKKGLVRKIEDLATLKGNTKLPDLGFQGGDHEYFRTTIEPGVEEKKSDYSGDYYKFYVLKDGKFVDRPAPSNIFSKIAFYFKKYIWNIEVRDAEKRLIDDMLEEEQKEINKVPEDVDKQLIADLTPLGDAKEMTATEEQIAPENDLQTETVSEQEKEKEIAEFKDDLKQKISKTNVADNTNTEKILKPLVEQKNIDNEIVVES